MLEDFYIARLYNDVSLPDKKLVGQILYRISGPIKTAKKLEI